jgi:hypothetical protein
VYILEEKLESHWDVHRVKVHEVKMYPGRQVARYYNTVSLNHGIFSQKMTRVSTVSLIIIYRATLIELYAASLATRSHPVHALFGLSLNDIGSALDEPSKTHRSCIFCQELPERIIDDIVDVHLRDTMRDVLLEQLAVVSAIPFGASTV